MQSIKSLHRKLSYYVFAALSAGLIKSEKVKKYPLAISIEASANCNLRCKYCYYPQWEEKVKRRQGAMSLSLFTSLVEHMNGRSDTIDIDFDSGGEPFSNPHLMDMVDIACLNKSRAVSVTTNGTLLNDDILRRILESGLRKIYFSIDVVRGKNIRLGSDLAGVTKNIDKLLLMRKRLNSRAPQVVVRSIDWPETSKKSIYSLFKGKPDSIFFNPPSNWSGLLEQPALKGGYNICLLPWLKLNMLHDGRFSICCNDPRAEYIVGQFPHETIKQIWQGEKYSEIRRRILGKCKPFLSGQNCGSCSRLRNSLTVKQVNGFLFQKIKNCFN